MIHIGNKGFTRLETVLGLVVVTAVLATAGPLLWRGSGQDRPRQAVHRAAEIAAAVLDYRAETGDWPAANGAALDVACLTRAPARRAPVRRTV